MTKLLKIETTETLSREAAAAQLRALADEIARHNDVELESEGKKLEFHVADEVKMEIEVEVKDDGTELEIELKW